MPDLSDELKALLAEQPDGSPPAVSAWMARRLANTIFTAFRTMGKYEAEIVAEGVAFDLEALADLVEEDPDA